MSVKGGVAGEADPWRTIPSCARERGGWEGSEAAGADSIKIILIDFKKELIDRIIKRSDEIQQSKRNPDKSLWCKKEIDGKSLIGGKRLMLKEIGA